LVPVVSADVYLLFRCSYEYLQVAKERHFFSPVISGRLCFHALFPLLCSYEYFQVAKELDKPLARSIMHRPSISSLRCALRS